MKTLILDIECTTSNKGNPFDQTNKLVCVGVRYLEQDRSCIYYDLGEDCLLDIQDDIDNADLLVFFNGKFDLHWLRRIGINISNIKVWDTQLGEFLLNNQSTPYPSLDHAAEKYGLDKKLDVVKTEYWEKNIDTDAIPREILSAYLQQDLLLTEQVYLKQVEQFKDNGKSSLFKLQCLDLLTLQEMEYNGNCFNTEKAREHAESVGVDLERIHSEIMGFIGDVPVNLGSNDHLSCILYGGDVIIDDRIPIGEYKTGAKIGQTRYKVVEKIYTLPRLVEPLKNTEVKKSKEDPTGPQYWQVGVDIIRKLKLNVKARKIVDLLGKHTTLEKLRGTYLLGWSTLIDTMHWEHNMIHGNLNQCVAITGRLSSTRPNLQNADPQTKVYMESRYA